MADLGFEHIILTVYQMSWSEKQDTAALVRFAAEHPLEGITFPAELADTPGYVEALLEAQVPSSSTRSMTRRIRPPWSARASRASTLISGRPPPGIRRTAMETLNFAIPTLFGLEALAADELRRLGLDQVRAENGRVLCSGRPGDIPRMDLNLRTGERVLLVLGTFPAGDFDALFEGTRALPLGAVHPPGGRCPLSRGTALIPPSIPCLPANPL